MKFRYILLLAAFSCGMSPLTAQSVKAQQLPYKNSSLPIPTRVQDLLARMTLEEKVGQLSKQLGWDMYLKEGAQVRVSEKFKKAIKEQHIGLLWATFRADPWTQKTLDNGLHPEDAARATNAIQRFMLDSTRLGIPLLLSEEAPHGHMAIGATVFPTAIGQASTWNPPLIQQMASAIGLETAAVGGRNGYGPVLDLAREPRWSRTEESYGEDPVLIGKMGQAMVQGFQADNNIIATLKHFVAYGNPEGGHNGGAVSVGERSLLQYYLPPFEAAVKVGAGSVMTAYNSIDGIPCSSNPWLLNDILRKEWGFKGFVVSDLLSISGLTGNHATAADAVDAAAQSLSAGLDVDLSGTGYDKNLLEAVKYGRIAMAELDQAVSRVLAQKFTLGLFDKPYVEVKQVKNKVGTPAHIALARQVARESIILLKNQGQLLPLRKDLKRIAVIGPNADNVYNQLGDYTAPQVEGKVKTVLQGIRKAVSAKTQVDYVKGCGIRDTLHSQLAEAVQAAQAADVVVLVVGGSSARDFKTSYQATGAADIAASKGEVSDMESGEGFDRVSLDLMGDQLKLIQAIHRTGKPIVLVSIKGRPLNLNWVDAHIPAIIDAWYPGQEGGLAIADVLFGDYNPAGRLPISVPRSVGQIPIYYNQQKPLPHAYIEMEAKPLYAFGYGLSYTQFNYDKLQVELQEAGEDFSCTIRCTVSNVGAVDGDEVVQLYVVDEVSSVVTPVIALKDFRRQHIPRGSRQEVVFQLSKADLKIWGMDKKWITEKGRYRICVGSSSDQIKLQQQMDLQKNYYF